MSELPGSRPSENSAYSTLQFILILVRAKTLDTYSGKSIIISTNGFGLAHFGGRKNENVVRVNL